MSKSKAAALENLKDDISVEEMKQVSGGLSVQTAVMPSDRATLVDSLDAMQPAIAVCEMPARPAVLDMQNHLVESFGGGPIHHEADVSTGTGVSTGFSIGDDLIGASGEAHAEAGAGASAGVTIDEHGITAGAEVHAGA